MRIFMMVFVLASSTTPHLMAQNEDPCRVLNWDEVTNGDAFKVTRAEGECEYEVDLGGSPASLQINLPQEVQTSAEFSVRMLIDASGFNQDDPGHFRVLSVQVEGHPELLFGLDLSWPGKYGRFANRLNLEPHWRPFAQSQPAYNGSYQVPPVLELDDGFSGMFAVQLNFFQSSGPTVADGRIEIWVGGLLELEWPGLVLDWTHSRPLDSVRFGVVEIHEPQTSGALRFRPIFPAPYHTDEP